MLATSVAKAVLAMSGADDPLLSVGIGPWLRDVGFLAALVAIWLLGAFVDRWWGPRLAFAVRLAALVAAVVLVFLLTDDFRTRALSAVLGLGLGLAEAERLFQGPRGELIVASARRALLVGGVLAVGIATRQPSVVALLLFGVVLLEAVRLVAGRRPGARQLPIGLGPAAVGIAVVSSVVWAAQQVGRAPTGFAVPGWWEPVGTLLFVCAVWHLRGAGGRRPQDFRPHRAMAQDLAARLAVGVGFPLMVTPIVALAAWVVSHLGPPPQ